MTRPQLLPAASKPLLRWRPSHCLFLSVLALLFVSRQFASAYSASPSPSDHEDQAKNQIPPSPPSPEDGPPTADSWSSSLSQFFTALRSSPWEWLRSGVEPTIRTPFYERHVEGVEGARRPQEVFDYIVVGAGAAGCPFARTMADAGKRVLVIERGHARSRAQTPAAMDLNGAGRGINDDSISQPVITTQGVRTHIGKVTGGGTSVNVGIMVRELDEYFHFLNDQYGHSWDTKTLRKASTWIEDKVSCPMPQENAFSRAICQGLADQGFTPHGGFDATGKNYTYPIPVSAELRHGEFWGAMSLFNSSASGFRNAADLFLVDEFSGAESIENFTPAKNIELLTDHIVLKVLFDRSGNRPRARCVNYRRTQESDLASLGEGPPRRRENNIGARPAETLLSKVGSFFAPRVYHACVKEDGEIVMSSGAILSAVNLFKSGVGPAEQIKALGLPLVLDVPQLGQRFSDRIAVPIGVFLTRRQQQTFSKPRISDVIGFRAFGPDCSDFKIGERTLKCTQVIVETMYGPHAMDGPIYAARALVPPHLRNTRVIEATFQIFSRCAQLSRRERFLKPVCLVLNRGIECASRTAVQFSFTSEPKSRGYVSLDKDGKVTVEANYLKDPQDFFDAVRGVQLAIERVNGDAFRGLIDSVGKTACPVMLLDAFLQIVTRLLEQTSPTSVTPELLEEVRKHHDNLAHLYPFSDNGDNDENDGNDESMSVQNPEGETKESPTPVKGESRLDSLQRIAEMQQLLEDLVSHEEDAETTEPQPRSSHVHTLRLHRLAGLLDETLCSNTCRVVDDRFLYGMYTKTCPWNDAYYGFYGLCSAAAPRSSENSRREFVADSEEGSEDDDHDLVLKRDVPAFLSSASAPDDPKEIAEYVLTYMSSIWHHAGTAEMGTVVDDLFRVKGLDGLSIVDASVLPQITRGNPTATLLLMGRYAALRKLEAQSRSERAGA
ncbi:putative GMC oxidoreductase [Neospora caninum Liverpool]|uniref:GMC oxidoreductase, putative n=1 Tax=Neospora caninum (strain Liverpool) TaxID=572307 RepID=F0VEJ8_NEOCL|nr:putative GMC oxidoreductase [Neospora caninum Liverpool]CBZ52142.1 putative GMC oxidoreductase [Neospora caninum Liverpool]CEL66105.1 TPA: GMC oxidoreductase, putative [Neospora caninum Liverpool]|eukprot:XP_003882174.1 putative GMC oxidoreductase [Neospora caninum Liverpool]